MERITLPARDLSGKVSLNETLQKRASCRNFDQKSIFKTQLSNILWSGQGVLTTPFNMRRTTPSAGSTFPIELLVAVRKKGIEEVPPGIYHYLPKEHALEPVSDRDITGDISEVSFNQAFIKKASASLLIASDDERTTRMYADRGERYVYMEAGAAMQNIALEAVELGLGTVIVGAFDDSRVEEVFQLEKLRPLAIMPIGYPRDKAFYA
jgi:SagB-type dehydrogenase family enzyme